MIEFAIQSQNLPFSVALVIMLMIALLEGVGMLLGAGLFALLDSLLPEFDADIDAPDIDSPGVLSMVLGWLYVGKVPLLVIVVLFLTTFGLSGLFLQGFLHEFTGHTLPGLLASIPAFFIALPLVRISARWVARMMPRDETEAVNANSFIGRVAVVTLGEAKKDYPAQARLTDQFGQNHYVMIEPESDTEILRSGDKVLLVEKRGILFVAILNPSDILTD